MSRSKRKAAEAAKKKWQAIFGCMALLLAVIICLMAANQHPAWVRLVAEINGFGHFLGMLGVLITICGVFILTKTPKILVMGCAMAACGMLLQHVTGG